MSVVYGCVWGEWLCVFFQAEDGIRDAQESRGLGDVYKRQMFNAADVTLPGLLAKPADLHVFDHSLAQRGSPLTVSYTHLTLPTIYSV